MTDYSRLHWCLQTSQVHASSCFSIGADFSGGPSNVLKMFLKGASIPMCSTSDVANATTQSPNHRQIWKQRIR